jgi:hypothetical protein
VAHFGFVVRRAVVILPVALALASVVLLVLSVMTAAAASPPSEINPFRWP